MGVWGGCIGEVLRASAGVERSGVCWPSEVHSPWSKALERFIHIAEKTILLLIAGFTVYGVALEMFKVVTTGRVELTDLLLMFIYAEVLGMVGAFYASREIPINIPIFIAITALCRLVILQGKEASAINLIYEGGAVLLLALAAFIIRWRGSVRRGPGAE